MTILLLEDDETNATLIQYFLEKEGFITLAAKNAEEALRFGDDASQAIDLLLTDIMLSGCRGTEIAGQLAATRPGLKTLFMSGYPLDSLSGELPKDPPLLHAQMFFLQKPFTGSSLKLKIAEVLGCEVANAPLR